MRLTLDWMASLLFFIKGKPADAVAVLNAHLSFLKNIRNDIRKRKNNTTVDLKRKLIGRYRGLIAIQFFVFNKRTFEEL
jgi:hypothetical protein